MSGCIRRFCVFSCLALRLLVASAVGLHAAGALAAAVNTGSMTDSVVVKLRDVAVVDAAAGLSAGARARLDAAMRTPFAHVGYTHDGALQLQLLEPLTLDAARAAVNRTRLLPEVLYANLVPAASAVGDGIYLSLEEAGSGGLRPRL